MWPDGLAVQVRQVNPFKYTTQFIGESGKILKITFDNPAAYTLTAPDRYVRAKVISSGGEVAWTQPVFRE